jgi:hypothetical protein
MNQLNNREYRRDFRLGKRMANAGFSSEAAAPPARNGMPIHRKRPVAPVAQGAAQRSGRRRHISCGAGCPASSTGKRVKRFRK